MTNPPDTTGSCEHYYAAECVPAKDFITMRIDRDAAIAREKTLREALEEIVCWMADEECDHYTPDKQGFIHDYHDGFSACCDGLARQLKELATKALAASAEKDK